MGPAAADRNEQDALNVLLHHFIEQNVKEKGCILIEMLLRCGANPNCIEDGRSALEKYAPCFTCVVVITWDTCHYCRAIRLNNRHSVRLLVKANAKWSPPSPSYAFLMVPTAFMTFTWCCTLTDCIAR